ncbi:hypothetical protein Tdes44962_MAKER00734 [Teratosphaeria destructans]|uniref:Uncharacterized protein n=1 Tax=Teratosphaeria destructans TaxID=418781 RepID=A0A9W7SLU1_9PEZI|nr:hypothetical protein Tdes44962_MAKER00734 [Teratosphaeria destructans]
MATKNAISSSTAVPVPTRQKTVSGNEYASDHARRKDIKVRLQYLKDDPIYRSVKPVQITPNFADKEKRTNVKLESGELETIVDVRGLDESFTLDQNGFRYVKAPTRFEQWSSQPRIAEEYLPELESLLKREVDGCDEIYFYDARIRQAGDDGVRVSGLSYNPFARQVHADNTERSVLEKIHNLTEIKADYYLSGRARIINIWRPIKHPVYDCGLAIADGGLLEDGDIIECDRHKAETGRYWDTMGVAKYKSGYRWYYCSEQAEEDVLLFKNFDTATNVPARTVLHTAFDIPPEDVPPDAPTRESIEVRALIFTYPAGPKPLCSAQSEHPLAVQLKASDLRHVDDEQNITDRLRTDIDEADEVKDAVLLLRRQEIRRLERVRDALIRERDGLLSELRKASTERDLLKTELSSAQEQLRIQAGRISLLESETGHLQRQLLCSHAELHKHPEQTSQEFGDSTSSSSPSGVRTYGEEDGLRFQPGYRPERQNEFERELLTQRIERQDHETQKLRNDSVCSAAGTVSKAWQASVDEAVRREREKHAVLVKTLQDEIKRLRAA